MPAATTYSVQSLPPGLARRVTIDAASGCWRVDGYHDRDGYTFYAGQGAHRAAYKLLVGPIPEGLQLDHVLKRGCVWRDCCWPAHLEPVTPRANTLRGRGPTALNYRKTACGVCGEPYDLVNCYVSPDGHRRCRKCSRAAVARYKQRQQEKQAADSQPVRHELARAA